MYVSVLVEPFQLARVTGYRAYVRCSLPTAGAAGGFVLGARAAFRSRRRQGRRWGGMASYGLSAGSAAAQSDAEHSSAARCFLIGAEEHYAAMPPGILPISRLRFCTACAAACLLCCVAHAGATLASARSERAFVHGAGARKIKTR